MIDGYHGGPPYAPVNPADERTYDFLRKYLKDLSELFESDYWHLGGDEVSIGCVQDLPATEEFLKEKSMELKNLQAYYIKTEREIFKNLMPDAVVGYWNRGEKTKYQKGDILQHWGGNKLEELFMKNPDNYVIYSPSITYYLD